MGLLFAAGWAANDFLFRLFFCVDFVSGNILSMLTHIYAYARSPRWRIIRLSSSLVYRSVREFEPRRVHTRMNVLGFSLVTCGKRESVN